MAAGRPKKDLDVLPKGWQEAILELYKEGASDVEIRGLIYEWHGSFSPDLWYRWLEEEQEFSKTVKRGQELSAIWWQKQGRQNLKDQSFSATLWYMNMKNRFGWADNQKTEVKATVLNVTIPDDDEDGEG